MKNELITAKLMSCLKHLPLFRDPSGRFYVVHEGDSVSIPSEDFEAIARNMYMKATGRLLTNQALGDASKTLMAIYSQTGDVRNVYTRVAYSGGRIYLDLNNAQRDLVEISPGKWCITRDVPVHFIRSAGMLPLPNPIGGGNLEDELRQFVNAQGDGLTLATAWLLGTLQPAGSYPILQLNGEKGSAKTTASKLLRTIIDPNVAPVRAMPRNERDLTLSLTKSHIGVFDNLSTIPKDLSDMLCRVATGQAFVARALYSDDAETILNVRKPVILNGIGDLTTRSDLVDRSLLVTLPSISREQRRPENELMEAFTEAHPRILGALLDTAAAALKRLPLMRAKELPRMADFAQWILAAEPSLGWSPGSFMAAFDRNLNAGESVALESSAVGMAIVRFVDEAKSWKGSATELLSVLNDQASAAELRDACWPRAAHSLSKALAEVTPCLRAKGICVDKGLGTGGRRYIVLKREFDPGREDSSSLRSFEGCQ